MPEQAGNWSHQRSPTGNPDRLRPGRAQVDPLPDWLLCGIVAGVFCWPNAGNAPLTRPLAIMGDRWHARPSFIDPREPRQWHEVF